MEPTGKKPVKGIKIRTVNLIMILISCCLYLFLTTATIRAFRKYEALISQIIILTARKMPFF